MTYATKERHTFLNNHILKFFFKYLFFRIIFSTQFKSYSSHFTLVIVSHKLFKTNLILSFNNISTEDKLWSVYLHACLKYLKGEHLTNQSLRERFCIEEKNKAIISRLISDAVSKKLIKVFDETTAPRYKSYVPIWA